MIQLRNLSFAYPGSRLVLSGLDLTVDSGSYVTVLGANGTGKSTLAMLLKGLQAPTGGNIVIDGIVSDGELSRYEFMKRVGLVFQNPDNTIVTTTVETELAFGLENIGIPRNEMAERVTDALERFHLTEYRHANPTHLSGGEKQRLALASVMIMRPAYLVLDEPTALLDPPSRRVVTGYLRTLAAEGTTVIHITQFADEATCSDRVIALAEGKIADDGSPDEVLPRFNGFRSCGVHDLSRSSGKVCVRPDSENVGDSPALVKFDHAGFVYEPATPFAHRALEPVNFNVPATTATVVLGPSGSGKTTLLELAAGLAMPTTGLVAVNGDPVRAMAFQLPEDQMFGQDIASYVAFGPYNGGIRDEELTKVVDDALSAVGLPPEQYRHRDPQSLSGGERRLAALAGVLAMCPGLLVLDEPTAGLDREGMERIIDCLGDYLETGGTLIFSTHDFEVAHALASHAIVLDHGRIETQGKYNDVVMHSPWVQSLVDISSKDAIGAD